MKLAFTLVIKGDERLEAKLKKAIHENYRLHTDLIEGFLAPIVRKLNIKDDDNIAIEDFKAQIIDESKT